MNSASQRPSSPTDVIAGMTANAIFSPAHRLSPQSLNTLGWASAVRMPSCQARSRRPPSSGGSGAAAPPKYVSGIEHSGQRRAVIAVTANVTSIATKKYGVQ